MTSTLTYPNLELPHPKWRLPLLGDILTINPAKPTQTSMADAQKLGPIFERRIVSYPIVIVSGADLVAEVNDESAWTKHVGVLFKKLRPISRDGLFTAYNHEPNWAKAHNILAPAFTQTAMRGYHETMTTTAQELTSHWAAHDGEWVDVARDMNRFTLEVIARTGFGYTFDSFDSQGEHPFVEAMMRGLTYINRNSNLPPVLQKTLGRRKAAQHVRDVAYVKKVVDDVVINRKRKDDNGGVGHTDLLERMLTTADPDTGEQLDALNIRNQILTFLVAGHETSAGVMAFALYYLAKHPELADRARAEIDQQFAGGSHLAYADVAKMRFLRRVVDETLRLWPIAPGYFREAKQDVTIGGGRYRFAKGDWVFVLTLQAHRDKQTWGEDAETFDPDRFLPDRLRRLDNYVYKPFGSGLRACIGRQFAYHEVLLALAYILRAFTFEGEPDYELDVVEQITLKPNGFRIRPHRRRI